MSRAGSSPVTVGIVGAGTMGSGIARVALAAGHRVRIHDVDPAAAERARIRILQRLAEMDEAAADRLAVVAELPGVADGATIVIEAAIEDLAAKRSIFAALDAVAAPGTILATNTSALSVAAIAAATARPECIVGLHFFNPAPVMRLVEVVAPPGVDARTIDRAVELVRAWDKTAVVCADTPGFIVNRVNRPFTLEALRLLEDGLAPIERIDAALRDVGFPMGPFELMDFIGIDVNLAAARSLHEAFDGAPRFRPSPIQERLVAAGRLGRKAGIGFYGYDEEGRATGLAEPDAAAGGREARMDLDREAIAERIVLGIVNEAYRALGDGVASADRIDLALRLGARHPSGPFERVAALGGPVAVLGSLERLAVQVSDRFEPAPALRSAAI
ncbi:MAG: 3-hydroxyacyl-CoA dehydrogenase [Candidatus Limnocylindrales bacterium]